MDEMGNQHQHVEPVTTPHETARFQADGQSINYDKIITERAEAVAQAAEKDEQLEAQDAADQYVAAATERHCQTAWTGYWRAQNKG